MIKKIGIHRKRGAPLGTPELIAIALGGMVGGGIFTILGIAVSIIGAYTPIAILIGGLMAGLAAYSYIKLGVYFKDEGATYSFFKKVFPSSPFAISLIGWWVIFGYISTIALYAFTFASYAISILPVLDGDWIRKGVAGCIITVFAILNICSVKGMGKIEDLMVYSKLVILLIISFVLINNSQYHLPTLLKEQGNGVPLFLIFIVSSLTFVSYEGFQLVINAVNEITEPERKIPIAIYSSIAIAILIYFTISLEEIIQNKEAALAAGAEKSLGLWGRNLVVIGASRQMAVIALDGYFPNYISKRTDRIPVMAIITMSTCAFFLILSGELRLILEYGSITFLLVSLVIAFANYTIRDITQSSILMASLAISCLMCGVGLIFYYELSNHLDLVLYIIGLYLLLSVGAWKFSRSSN